MFFYSFPLVALGAPVSRQSLSFTLDHTECMKPVSTFGSLVLVTISLGCATHKSATATATDAPDGFYVGTTNIVGSFTLRVFSPSGSNPSTFRIHSSVFVPERVVVSSAASQIPGGYYVQVSGHATEEMLDLSGIIFVADHTGYFGDGKRVGSSATATLLLSSLKEVDTVASAMRKRYSLP